MSAGWKPSKRDNDCCSSNCIRNGGKKVCRPAPGAFGCTVNKDVREGNERPCPDRPEGVCVVLNDGKPFCVAFGVCARCETPGDCQLIPGAGKPKCVRQCRTCRGTSPSACVYRREGDEDPP